VVTNLIGQEQLKRNMDYNKAIIKHYTDIWHITPNIIKRTDGKIYELPVDFSILEFAPIGERNYWAYATSGMSFNQKEHPTELHFFSPDQSQIEAIILTSIAHFHLFGERIGLGHTVNFGIPWRKYSKCTYGLISLPYNDGPNLENMVFNKIVTKFYWVIPITKEEREFKIENGLNALEEKFDVSNFNYINPMRESLIH